ncbi:hypothetical protein JCM8097_002344 [Rhodosporidiobolus ruineniae]
MVATTTSPLPPPAAPTPSAPSSSSSSLRGSRAPLAYILIRWLFRLVLGVFYSDIVVEGADNVPPDGVPCIISSNHSNSLTDALLLVTTVPSSRRSILRLTAKDSQFGRGTFTSWLIESAGTLPIKRPKDHKGVKVDNSVVFEKLIHALGQGDAVCMFPEGMSRYHPEIAPLRQGVSRIVSETLSRHASEEKKDGREEFKLAVQTCSITYLHRNLFRSDVLVTFHPPLYVSAASHPSLITPSSSLYPSPSSASTAPEPALAAHETAIRSLTAQIGASIRSGILDAPSWAHLRLANTVRRLYAPLGTRLTLGDHVRLTQRFVDALAGKRAERRWEDGAGSDSAAAAKGVSTGVGGVELNGTGKKRPPTTAVDGREKAGRVLQTPMRERKSQAGVEGGYFGAGQTTDEETEAEEERGERELGELRRDLKDLLYLHGLKDDRIRNPRLLHRRILLKRLFVRIATSVFLFLVAVPGLGMWVPVFWATRSAQERLVRGGPKWDTYDEIAQTKLAVGLGAGVSVLLLSLLLTFPFMPLVNLVVLPGLMWLTLRFLEDLFSSLRAAVALLRLLLLGKSQLLMLRDMRAGLHERVEKLAVERAGLPRDAGVFVRERERRWKRLGLGRIEGGVREWLGFFDPRRRRKKDWNEALKLFDQTEYAEDEEDEATSGVKTIS